MWESENILQSYFRSQSLGETLHLNSGLYSSFNNLSLYEDRITEFGWNLALPFPRSVTLKKTTSLVSRLINCVSEGRFY